MDDTPNKERVRLMHRSTSYLELLQDGDRIDNTVGEKFDYRTATNGNSTMLLAACRAKSIEDLRQKVTNRSACVLKIYQRIIEKPASKI